MGSSENDGSGWIAVAIIIIFLAAILPILFLSTTTYEYAFIDPSKDEIIKVYDLTSTAKRVWIDSVRQVEYIEEPELWVISFRAREVGGDFDIYLMLQSAYFEAEYFRIDSQMQRQEK